MGSFACYAQDHLTKSSRPYVRVNDPGRRENRQIKVAFLLGKSVKVFCVESFIGFLHGISWNLVNVIPKEGFGGAPSANPCFGMTTTKILKDALF